MQKNANLCACLLHKKSTCSHIIDPWSTTCLFSSICLVYTWTAPFACGFGPEYVLVETNIFKSHQVRVQGGPGWSTYAHDSRHTCIQSTNTQPCLPSQSCNVESKIFGLTIHVPFTTRHCNWRSSAEKNCHGLPWNLSLSHPKSWKINMFNGKTIGKPWENGGLPSGKLA